jgi:triosephosphate isomerase
MKPIIIANWKMNPSNSKDAFALAKKVANGVKGFTGKVDRKSTRLNSSH